MSVDLRETITAARRDGRQRDIRCPAHHDKRASLSVGRGDDGGVVLHCHAGCETEGVLAAAGLTWADLRERRNGDRGRLPQIVATYDYTDDHGTLLYQVCRFAPKDFRQRKPDGAGGWTWRIGQTRRVLFGLPELRGHKIVYVPEGEKDAVALRALGLVATTNAGGAGKWRDEYAHQLRAAGVESVVVLPDNDDPGQKHAADVARSCHGAGLKVKIVTLPDLPPKADVSAWLASGHTRDDLMVAVESTAVFHAAASDKPAGETAKDKPDKRKQGREVQLDDPEPWADPVGGGTLLNAIAATFSRYLVLPKQANVALALWVLHAYAFDAWFTSPFLAITSPAKRCGKTLLLIVLGALVPRRLFASNVTPAVLFRTIEKYRPVLLIDEADTFVRDNDELRGVLNSGHTRTTAVAIRAVGDDHDPRAFSTWCPKAIALIGKLPGTLADRAIKIQMRRRTAGEQVERLRQDRIEALCADLRRQAARWAEDHLCELQDSDPAVPDALHDRAADCWRPLLAIADAIGGAWAGRAREAALALSGESGDEDTGTLLLRDIQTIFAEDHDPDVLPSSVLIERLVALEDRPWVEWSSGRPLSPAKLARLLAGYGVHPAGTVRIGTKTAKGYRRSAFIEAWMRYVTPEGDVEASQRNNANVSGHEPAFSNRHNGNGCDALQSVTNPINTARSYGVTLSGVGAGEDSWLDM